MVHIPSPPAGPEILTAIRREFKAAGGKRVSLNRFTASTGICRADVFRHFPRWDDAVRAAGFDLRRVNELIPSQLLLEDWGALARTLRKLPSKTEYKEQGKYCTTTLEDRFGGWTAMPGAFLEFANGKPEWADLQALVPTFEANTSGPNRKSRASKDRRKQRLAPARPRQSPSPSRARASFRGPVYGDPLDFGAMRHAPVNEAGVMLLFAIMADRLGFIIQSVRPNFPDCDTLRKTGANQWRRVRIEFEYESRNFREHGHDPAGCDLIVCWGHNWPDCPVEVLALRDEIAGMEARTATPSR